MAKMDTSGERRPRKKWPEALKREIVAATFFPGASVSIVARQYDVNANQVFSWRRRYREAGEPPPSASSTPGLVPVRTTLLLPVDSYDVCKRPLTAAAAASCSA
jgi:transposase